MSLSSMTKKFLKLFLLQKKTLVQNSIFSLFIYCEGFGVIFGTMNKFASSKFKEIYQHNKQVKVHNNAHE